ncbi:PLP-dependent aminotransferase family protein [Sphingobacterium kyonggiense]|uniref:PLP-dependent aminotransferase family protein n=1 Tax=Sphingobacterium kyonggiense TaxID=714075 RepID=A0ABP7YT37_9SPHI
MYYLAGPSKGTSIKMINSPVDILYANFIHLDRNSSIPIYLQIANQLILAINRGTLKPGSRLLGTRQLANQLQVHRNTVIAAFEELLAQGWVEIKPNKGTFVAEELPLSQKALISPKRYPQKTGYSFEKTFLFDNPYEISNCQYVWNDGTPDIRLTQINDLSRVYSANLKRRSNQAKMGYYNQEGSEYFKEQLLSYLKTSRGLRINLSNLLITRSMEMSLYILTEILLKPKDIVVITELNYFSANMTFQKSGSIIRTVPVDEEGLDTQALRSICEKEKIRMVYLNSHMHYPTVVSLSAKRRMEIMQLAVEFNFIIVEDDPDYDFQFDKPALMPLAANDENGMVIYISSFGKSLAPGFRTGFIVCPDNLMQEMYKYLGLIDRQGDVLMEQALGELIEEGLIHRHIKKSLKSYRERRDIMARKLNEDFKEEITFEIPNSGLAYWLHWKKPINLLKLSQIAAKHDLFIPKTLLYQKKDLCAMRVGFGNLTAEEIIESLDILRKSFNELEKLG